MENEIDKLYPNEYSEDEEQISEEQSQDANYSEVPPDFKYTPVEIPHKVDIFVLILAWIIIGVLGYVLFATTSIFE